jgi:spermidine synthase
MIPRELIDEAPIPGGGTLRLIRRGADYSIMLGANELMNSRLSGSEEALATLAWERMAERTQPAVLIGGLGMGFTLRAALARMGAQAQVTVAELVPAVIAWGRGPLAHIHGPSLSDPRLRIFEGDVAALIGSERQWDAILLDVDNGPDGISQAANDGLYSLAGLRSAKRALRPGGVYALWSSAPDRAFTQRLRKAGFDVDEVIVRANGGRGGARHTIWLARPAAGDFAIAARRRRT